ncbi:MAG: HlyD family secretion protein [Thiohalomonadales bacterium]
MNYNHPYSEISRNYFITTPIVPAVSGTVIEVPVTPNKHLKAGDVLFKIDPAPFEYKVASLKAQLVAASADVKRAKRLVKQRSLSQRDLDLAIAKLDDLTAQLGIAEFDLKNTVVRASTDGIVVQMALKPGMRAVSIPLRPVMIFVHDDIEEHKYFVGWFRQNSLLRLEIGNDAEVVFDGIPGEVFSGEVKMVLPVLMEGQIQPTGNLINPRIAPFPGRIAVIIDITDPEFDAYAKKIPGGAYAQSAIYTQHFSHIAIMRKILLRMAAWMNYIFPFH